MAARRVYPRGVFRSPQDIVGLVIDKASMDEFWAESNADGLVRDGIDASEERRQERAGGPSPLSPDLRDSQGRHAVSVPYDALATPTMFGTTSELRGLGASKAPLDYIPEHKDFPTTEYASDGSDSDSDSIFSADSVASTATSTESIPLPRLVNSMAATLLFDEHLKILSDAANEDADIGPEIFRRNVRRMIKTYGQDLRLESTSNSERRTASAIETRRVSTYAAHANLSQARLDQRQVSIAAASGDIRISLVNAGTLSEEEDYQDHSNILHFMLSSKAYASFKIHFVEFCHLPYEKRLLAAIEGTAIAERGAKFSLEGVRTIAKEISRVPPPLLSFPQSRPATFLDFMKCAIEDQMGEVWDWWPLGPRSRFPQDGSCRLQWKTLAGAFRTIEVPENMKREIENVIATAPAFINTTITGDTNACSPGKHHTSGSVGRRASSLRSSSRNSNAQSTIIDGVQEHPKATGRGITAIDDQNATVPGPPDGPITEAEFRDHFYNSQSRHHTWFRAQKCRFYGAECSAVQSLPKRKEALELEDAKREYFYGLYARERRCFAWVSGYFLACQVPSIVFFFLWPFHWKHTADLKGASVPASLSVALTFCWLAYIIESREKS